MLATNLDVQHEFGIGPVNHGSGEKISPDAKKGCEEPNAPSQERVGYFFNNNMQFMTTKIHLTTAASKKRVKE
jgi:hypothetical protein